MTLYASAEEDKQARKRAKDERGGRVLGEEERRWARYIYPILARSENPASSRKIRFVLFARERRTRERTISFYISMCAPCIQGKVHAVG